ncbi:MAG TPA: ABC transporter permease [Thermoplasmatales archaeon]|nr:ABC transporter permease [Thermoplasmatales archaeon]
MKLTFIKSDWLKFAIYRIRRSPLALLGIFIILTVVFVAIFAPYITPHPDQVYKINMENKLQPPSRDHLCGTDYVGRDVFSRIIFGSRISLKISIVVVFLASLLGTIVGLIAGFFRGIIENIIMRITDAFLSFPPLILALSIQAALGPSITNIMIALPSVWWTWYARIVRGQVLAIREELYIESARVMGANNFRIMFRHILPNCLGPIIVQATLQMGYAILTTAGLGFLGIGAQEPLPEWGLIVATGRVYISFAWWSSTFAGIAIFWTVLGFCLLGDAIRDIFERV